MEYRLFKVTVQFLKPHPLPIWVGQVSALSRMYALEDLRLPTTLEITEDFTVIIEEVLPRTE
jgi:hypothetical protein